MYTDVHFFNMNKEEFKHEQSEDILHVALLPENNQEGLNPKEQWWVRETLAKDFESARDWTPLEMGI